MGDREMSEAAPEAAPAQEQPTAEAEDTTDEQSKADETDWKAEARKWEQLAKKNNAKAEKAAERARLDAMSESERAIEEAKQAARSEAAVEFGQRLARTEFDALAGRRNKDFETAQALEYLDLKKFLDDNGEPDTKAIQAAVERLVPAPSDAPPSFDGGTRTPTQAPQDMNAVLRKATGRA